MPHPPDVLDRDIFAQSRAPPEAVPAAGVADVRPALDTAGGAAYPWRDPRARITHYGVTFSMPEKPGAVVGVSNPHIHAAMRAGKLEAFRMARDGSGALCHLTGADASLFDVYRKQTGAGS